MNPKNAQQSTTKTYNTIKTSVVQQDPSILQKELNNGSSGWAVVLIGGIFMLVIISSIIETGTFFGVLLPSDWILSIAVIVFVGLEKWLLVLLITLASIIFTIVGDMLWYATGKKLWSGLYDKEDTRYFKKKYFLEAQDAFVKRGDKMLYIGRYLSIGWFLPMLCGVMGMDQKKFFRLSVWSAIVWKLSLVIPMVLLMVIFPSIKYHLGILILVIFTLPELIGWIMLFMPKAQEYAERLQWAKAQIDAIRADMSHIASQMGTIVDQLKTPQPKTESSVVSVSTPTPSWQVPSDVSVQPQEWSDHQL